MTPDQPKPNYSSLYNVDDLWARRNPNTVLKEAGEPLTKTLLRRIIRWAEMARSEKTGQLYIHSDEFKADLHSAVVFNNFQHSKTGLSMVEKTQANCLWKKYRIFGRLTIPKDDTLEELKQYYPNNKIAAIKVYRSFTEKWYGSCVSLKSAKQYIDTLFDRWDLEKIK